MSKLMIHICCAHCAAYTVRHWREQGYEAGGFWYNPNIHPFTEHERRLEAVQKLSQEMKLPLIIADDYDMPEYFRRVASHEESRCYHCFTMRLTRTALTARREGYDTFTTTLLISPHQKHGLLKEIGEEVAAKSGLTFLYADLRKRYSDSRHITKPLDLYRQQYCGCLYSEWERFRKPNEKGL